MNNDKIQFLLGYCAARPELYNEVMNYLHERFEISSAEICLLVTYYVGEERRKYDKNNIKKEGDYT